MNEDQTKSVISPVLGNVQVIVVGVRNTAAVMNEAPMLLPCSCQRQWIWPKSVVFQFSLFYVDKEADVNIQINRKSYIR